MIPTWYGSRYPSFDDLVQIAEKMEARIGVADIGGEAIFFPADWAKNEPPVILIPEGAGPLRRVWLLAHELGHLMQHEGYTPSRTKQEAQANRWAACALIPESRIDLYENACPDAFIAALSAHYEDLPPMDCPSRRLAARIANIRLEALQAKIREAV